MVSEASLEQRLRLVEKEVASLGEELAELRLHLMAEAEAQRVEVEALKQFLAQAFPDFRERFPSAGESTIQENRPGPE